MIYEKHIEEDFRCVMTTDVKVDGPWRPIETAPKDGRDVLLGGMNEEVEVAIGYWRDDAWYQWDGFQCSPTNWMPLPDSPSKDQ